VLCLLSGGEEEPVTRLRKLRERKGWKQLQGIRVLQDLARLRGVQVPDDPEAIRVRWSAWENGHAKPHEPYLSLLAELFGVHQGEVVPAAARAPDPEMVAAAARESLEFAIWADPGQDPTPAMEHVAYELGRIASCYVYTPVGQLFGELLRLRDITFNMLRSGVPPRQARDMCVLTGTACVLLAHATENLGDPVSAMAQARTALACAEQAEHDGLRAWARGTAALIAEWTGRPGDAARIAREGQRYAQSAESRVRLAAIEARAHARVGDVAAAMDALDQARRARDSDTGQRDGIVECGGVLTFPPVKQRYYEGGTLVLAGQNVPGERAALDAIRLYEAGPAVQRSYGDEAIARVDVVTARVAKGDIEGAQAAITPVLALPPERRIGQLAATLAPVAAHLEVPRLASRAAADLAAEIREFTTSASRAALSR
jgi:transcriptional regulator with XRE-family HTH domain